VQVPAGACKLVGHRDHIETRPFVGWLCVGFLHYPGADHADAGEAESVAGPVQLGQTQQPLHVGPKPIARISTAVNQQQKIGIVGLEELGEWSQWLPDKSVCPMHDAGVATGE
jgi:hypothetical protein